jgi:eukaryotic-like serine/threonine-protein kinase
LSVDAIAGGRYRVEETIGVGGMATVYRAHDVELARPVALKVLAEQLCADDAFQRRFVREARLAARLSHPNVVQVYDAGESNGRPYIVMEYVPGETLAQLLARRHRLPPAEAAALAHHAALGLQHAHDAELVHRDVKPQNLLLREDGLLKITDFGIARAAESTRLTQLGTVLGTAAYLAPEQAAGDDVTAAADIYSLGAVLYELLTGRPPHEFSSLVELADKQRTGTITPVRELEPAVPEAMEAVVMSCLAREPRFRPASAAAVADALAPEPETKPLPPPTAVTRPSGRRPPRRIFRKQGLLWFAGALVVAAIALALGLAHLGGGGSRSNTGRAQSVLPPAAGATAADGARNLSRWLRAHSR